MATKDPPAEDVLLDVGTPQVEGGSGGMAWAQQHRPGALGGALSGAFHSLLPSISIPRLWRSLPLSSRALLLLGAAAGTTAAVFAATQLGQVGGHGSRA